MNDLDKAVAYQAKLNQLGDHSPELSYNLGVALQVAKRLEDAANAYTHALQTKPEFRGSQFEPRTYPESRLVRNRSARVLGQSAGN